METDFTLNHIVNLTLFLKVVPLGPGPSYCDKNSGAVNNDFTNRNITFMTWNLMHLARLLKDQGGIATYGNQAKAWAEGERFDYVKPQCGEQ